MHIRLQSNTLRYARYAGFTWALFITSFGLSQFGDLLFGDFPLLHTALNYLAEASFGAGCVSIVGLVGMRSLQRMCTY